MRIRTTVLWAVLVTLSFPALGEDRERRPNRRGNAPMPAGGGGPTLIKTGKNEVYLMVGGLLTAFDAKTLRVLARKDLNEEESEVRDAARAATDDAFSNLDKNGDGRLSADEVPIPERMLERMDRDRDGAVSRDEIPDFLIERLTAVAMRAAGVVGTPALEVSSEGWLYVYYNGWLYRLNGRTLSVMAKVKVEIPRPERQTPPGGGQPPAPDRFGDPEDDERPPMF